MIHNQILPFARAESPLELGDLVEFIEGQIERRASGQIRDLHVVCQDDMIILQGRSRTYHAKQLAQQAVLEIANAGQGLANQIIVC